MAVMTVPRTLIRASLSGLRLPLRLVERVTANGGGDWPPAIAYDSLEGELKIILGSLVRDEGLMHEGELQQAKSREMTSASRLEKRANDIRTRADADLEQRIDSVGNAAHRMEADANDREQQILVDKRAKDERLEEAAQVRQEAVAQKAAARDKLVTAEERQAARTRIAAESGALAARSRALSAADRAKDVEKRLDAKKTIRKS